MRTALLLLNLAFSTCLFAQTNNYSTSYDGIDDYTEVTNLNLNTSYTISLWVKLINNNGYAIFHHKNPCTRGVGITITAQSGNVLNAGILNCGVPCSPTPCTAPWEMFGDTISLNEWHYISLTCDGISKAKLYLDGIIQDSIDDTGIILPTDVYPMYFARVSDQNTFYNNINIDNVEYWNNELSELQIQNYMACPPVGTENGLIGFWNLEEGTGTTAGDLTSNGNDGTLTNGPTWSTDVPAYNCGLGISELSSQPKELINIVNLLGQEVEYTPNTVLIYQYSDGTLEKVFTFEK